MFSHVVIGTSGLQQSKRFYDKLLAALGYGPALPRGAGGPPGVRDTQFGRWYPACLRDPDGNKLCALHRM
jgi:hypothetical protein